MSRAEDANTRGKSACQTYTGHSPAREIVELTVSKQELNGPEIPSPPID
jgi:hypothetical protein